MGIYTRRHRQTRLCHKLRRSMRLNSNSRRNERIRRLNWWDAGLGFQKPNEHSSMIGYEFLGGIYPSARRLPSQLLIFLPDESPPRPEGSLSFKTKHPPPAGFRSRRLREKLRLTTVTLGRGRGWRAREARGLSESHFKGGNIYIAAREVKKISFFRNRTCCG